MARLRRVLPFGVVLFLLSACAYDSERPAALGVAARNLHCPQTEMESVLNRETPKVREYLVACNFTYTTVRCADGRCFPAKPKPPCFGGGCFTEDPLTLEWTLDDSRSISPAARAER
ncbi:MAG TPA: hypothetical protein VK745_26650 [Polyangiaceae bacterium]|jgi:hypothetical protein|nr:hypothetical protein [Polyangiaceae bacterium]